MGDTVVDLLRTYELGELEKAKAEGREPVDLGFLWKSAGIKRPAHATRG